MSTPVSAPPPVASTTALAPLALDAGRARDQALPDAARRPPASPLPPAPDLAVALGADLTATTREVLAKIDLSGGAPPPAAAVGAAQARALYSEALGEDETAPSRPAPVSPPAMALPKDGAEKAAGLAGAATPENSAAARQAETGPNLALQAPAAATPNDPALAARGWMAELAGLFVTGRFDAAASAVRRRRRIARAVARARRIVRALSSVQARSAASAPSERRVPRGVIAAFLEA